ncbi:MAG: TonB-dependent receptor [Gemmatimonadota bacterium]|nr:TonB-dependent receptor [Gemmatimonadota bacterium]
MMLPKFVSRTPRASGSSSRRLGWLASLALAVMLGASASAAEAQNGQVVGQVQDASSGAPLGEVQVHIPSAGLGVLSRADGRFVILNVPAGTYELRAERIGYAASVQEINVTAGEATEVNFALDSEALGLDEIVVTGTAGASRRREVGNTISQINVSDVPDRPTVATDLLQSAAPGVELTSAGGEVGQGKVIRLRGNSSVSMSNQPIIYIDGVRMMSGAFPQTAGRDYRSGRGANVTASPLDAINPNDIERIEIIKGSAATTLYGTEASAGVIQIFTKRGSAGAPVWTVETQQGTAWSRKFGTDDVPYLFMEPFLRDGWLGVGDGGWGPEAPDGSPNRMYDDFRTGATNWTQVYSASVRGGGQDLQYFVSGQYDDVVGMLPSDQLEKWTTRGNFTFTPTEGLQLQLNTGYTNQWQQNTPSGNNAQGLTLNVFRQDQNYFGSGDFDRISEVLPFDIQQRIERFTTGGTVTYSPLDNLTNRFTIGYDFSQQEARNLRPFGFEQRPDGALLNNTWQNRLLTFDYVGTYSLDINDALRSNFSWGGQAVGDEIRELEGWGEIFPGAAEPTVSSASIKIAEEERERVWNAGFFFQNVLDITDKYFLTTGVRVDGNSAFGEGFGLQVYPKVSGSWVISDESFWPEAGGQVKLRAAYGQSGRAPGAFDAVRTWDPIGWGDVPAFVPENVGNPDLGPEVTGEFEAGFDASWWNDRLNLVFTYYNQTTTDALLDVGQTPSSGFSQSQLQNVGELNNKGLEFGLNVTPIETADYSWDIGVDLTTNKSEVIDLGGASEFDALGGWVIEGQPVPVNRGFRVTNPDEIADPEYDEQYLWGPELPTRTVNLNTSLRLPRGIVLAARGEYRGGNVIEINPISVSRSVRSPLCYPYYQGETGVALDEANTPAIWRARCTPSEEEGYWYDADYFKLRSVSASIPMDFAFPDRVTGSTLTLSLNNSVLWMKDIPWMDPEMLGNQGANSGGLGATERVPNPISFRASLRITF